MCLPRCGMGKFLYDFYCCSTACFLLLLSTVFLVGQPESSTSPFPTTLSPKQLYLHMNLDTSKRASNMSSRLLTHIFSFLGSLDADHLPDPQNRFNHIMEASLSSGSDGFGAESGRQIFAFLDSSDVTCDSSIPGSGPRPTRQPVSAPTRAPVRRTRQPAVAPTRVPDRPPVVAPVRNPVRAPTKSPVISPVSPQCPQDESVCVAETDKTDRFACFSYDDIKPAACDGVHYVLTRCNNKMVGRNLNGVGCQASCVLLQNFVCLNGSTGDHELEFAGFDSQDLATGDTYIKKIPVRDDKDCIQARAKCNP
jgi:hypothetical protein